MNSAIKVILADDHPVYRDGLRQMLTDDPRLKLVHETGTGRDALEDRQDGACLDVAGPHRKAVHLGIVEGRHCEWRGDGLGHNAAQGGCSGNLLGLRWWPRLRLRCRR